MVIFPLKRFFMNNSFMFLNLSTVKSMIIVTPLFFLASYGYLYISLTYVAGTVQDSGASAFLNAHVRAYSISV